MLSVGLISVALLDNKFAFHFVNLDKIKTALFTFKKRLNNLRFLEGRPICNKKNSPMLQLYGINYK